jgi:hypothetical protein
MATKLEDKIDPAALYEADFYAWAMHQAETLRRFQTTRPSLPLDFEHLIEEVEGLARSDLRAARSQVRRLVEHLLKLEHSPAREPRQQWQRSVRDARNELGDLLSQALARALAPGLPELFADALANAGGDLLHHGEHESASALPQTCPYTLDRLTEKTWYPANRRNLVDDPL